MTQYHRHFGQFHGQEVVIAGYNKSLNSLMVVLIGALPQDEAEDLRRIAMSATAQNLDYLVPTLRVERHKSNQDWFTHIVTRLYRNDGAVKNVSIKEMEAMNEEQKAFFKGYGSPVEPTGGPSSRVGADNEFTTGVSTIDEEIIVAQPVDADTAPANLAQAEARGVVPTPGNDPEMARAAAQAGGGASAQDQVNLAILQTLQNINENLTAQGEAIAKLKPARTTRKKRATKKSPAAAPAAAAAE